MSVSLTGESCFVRTRCPSSLTDRKAMSSSDIFESDVGRILFDIALSERKRRRRSSACENERLEQVFTGKHRVPILARLARLSSSLQRGEGGIARERTGGAREGPSPCAFNSD